MSADVRPAWTTPDGLVRTLRKRWESGVFLSMFASGQPWQPLSVGIRGPRAADLATGFGDAQAWVQAWERVDGTLVRVEHKRVGGRLIGANSIPCRAWIDGYSQLWKLLGTEPEVAAFGSAVDRAKAAAPALTDWVIAHPVRVLSLAAEWDMILATVRWIGDRSRPGMYVRQIDVPGVDTKFIERHRAILTDLLDLQLPPGRIDDTAPRADFAARYGFLSKPSYVRFRYLALGGAVGPAGPVLPAGAPAGFTELAVRVPELAAAPPPAATVYVVENEITYLAFPPAPGAIVILGGGYAVPVLAGLRWLAGRELVYWGDIDTHGFAILARLRRRFPHTRSMLMDRATLLAHESQWVTEPAPATPDLDRLTPEEAALCRDLLTGRLGPSVRLEQERVRFSLVEGLVGGRGGQGGVDDDVAEV
ncbi:MAG TPA: Wadjet anti-phage system protein JetD domain-containing protein [Streptosporangiaceae bacterium]